MRVHPPRVCSVMITPAITDLWALRDHQQLLAGPATASIAVLTDSELPHVEKKVCSAPTASAMSSCARRGAPFDSRRSSNPLSISTSEEMRPRP